MSIYQELNSWWVGLIFKFKYTFIINLLLRHLVIFMMEYLGCFKNNFVFV